MSVKSAICASVLGAAFLFSGSVQASHDSNSLSPDEQNTLSILQTFEDCVNGKLNEIPQQEIQDDLEQVIANYIAKLEEQGIKPTEDIVIPYIQEYINQVYFLPAQNQCSVELNIDYDDLINDLRQLINDHGPEVLVQPRP